MHRRDVGRLEPTRTYWIAAVVAPERDWAGAAGSHRGSRFMIDPETLRPSRDAFTPFDSRLGCLSWIMHHRAELNRLLPGATVRAVRLDHWLLGLD